VINSNKKNPFIKKLGTIHYPSNADVIERKSMISQQIMGFIGGMKKQKMPKKKEDTDL
jgi:hypothetical protein